MFHVEHPWNTSVMLSDVPRGTFRYPRQMRLLAALLLLAAAASAPANAQWVIEESHTTASLRGIHNVGGGVAWASGTNGTVLRTEDGGYLWQTCSMPPGAEKLDFRGIQGFDENTAIVMSSGKGDLSRLYKTTDACQTWKLVFTNPDPEGFWDGLKMVDSAHGIVFGDPAKALSPVESGYSPTFRMRITADHGETWVPVVDSRVHAVAGSGLWSLPGESFFAASNSSLIISAGQILMGTSSGRVVMKPLPSSFQNAICAGAIDPYSKSCGISWNDWTSSPTPIGHATPSSGIFSLASNDRGTLIAAGGDYTKPEQTTGTLAYTNDNGQHWAAAETPPHGYRSAVVYDLSHKVWIAVGPNGTDVSVDDGKNWRALKPGRDDDPGADRAWNALSLPFVVGPKGRIGRLDENAVTGLRAR